MGSRRDPSEGREMRNLNEINIWRIMEGAVVDHYGWTGDETCGAFAIPSCVDAKPLGVVVSSGGGWDHVSVSRRERCPTWTELEQVKRIIFKDDEVAMQLHVPSKDHISLHPYCLHLWRPNDGREIPLPPPEMVA
jgi:hypothetical protein